MIIKKIEASKNDLIIPKLNFSYENADGVTSKETLLSVDFALNTTVVGVKIELSLFLRETDNNNLLFKTVIDLEKFLKGVSGNQIISTIIGNIAKTAGFELKFPFMKGNYSFNKIVIPMVVPATGKYLTQLRFLAKLKNAKKYSEITCVKVYALQNYK